MGSWILLPWVRILLCSLLFCCYHSQILPANTMYPGKGLSGKQTITSSKGIFQLGYFAIGNRYYLGICYKDIPTDNVVWVANRDNPLQDSTAEFKISEDGNLVIQTQSKVISWSTNLISTPSSPPRIVVLRDDGNLVLRDGNSSDNVFWDSFSHPTHTWLPGGSLGFNSVTNENQLLTSWRNKEDPSPGPFSLELDPNGTSRYFIVWNRTEQYWDSGVWNNQTFSEVPEMRANYLYNFSFVTNEKGRYFTYSVYNDSILTKFVIDLSGQIKQLTWVKESQQWIVFWAQPRDQCEVYGLCGDFGVCDQDKQNPCNCIDGFEPASAQGWGLSDWSGGCTRKVPLQCGRDQFSLQPGLNATVNSDTLTVNNAEGCKSACLEDCTCTAYSYQASVCSIWKGGLLNLRQQSVGNENSIYVRVANLETANRGTKKNAASVIIGISLGSVLVILVTLWGLVWIFRKPSSSEDSNMQGMLVSFRHKDLQNATKNFSEKLGGGGFGSVFKGTLPDSSLVAVKKLEGPRQGEKQFRTEVSTIGTIQHVNLVRLRGFCSEGTKRLLVYDFMENGSLDFHLFNFNCKPLNWKTRYQIALGTARGISYLHEECRDCIIHCDIKPENILLDAQFCPKVADFGLAKLLGREFSRVLTTFRGTRGYLAPEWLSGMPITTKADVYSYGMMLLELISGRRNVEHSEDGKVRYFPTWAANKIFEGEEFALLDPRLEGEADLGELTIACRVAVWCIQDEENSRPSMGQVVQVFEKLLEFGKPPVPRSLQVLVDHQENIVFFSEGSDRSCKPQTTDSSTSQAKSSSSFSV